MVHGRIESRPAIQVRKKGWLQAGWWESEKESFPMKPPNSHCSLGWHCLYVNTEWQTTYRTYNRKKHTFPLKSECAFFRRELCNVPFPFSPWLPRNTVISLLFEKYRKCPLWQQPLLFTWQGVRECWALYMQYLTDVPNFIHSFNLYWMSATVFSRK